MKQYENLNSAMETETIQKNRIRVQRKSRQFAFVTYKLSRNILNKSLVLIFLLLLLPFVCKAQKSKKKQADNISYFTTVPYVETKTLKTVYAYKNNTLVGYIKYIEQLSTVKKIKRTTYLDREPYTYTEVVTRDVEKSHGSYQWKENVQRTGYQDVSKNRDEVLSSKTDTTYVKECGCNQDYTAGEFKISKLYPDWSTMSEEQIKEWMIKNCNQETVDKLNNDFIEEKIRKNFEQKEL